MLQSYYCDRVTLENLDTNRRLVESTDNPLQDLILLCSISIEASSSMATVVWSASADALFVSSLQAGLQNNGHNSLRRFC